MTKQIIATATKIQIAAAVASIETTGLTKAAIAKEFNVSPRSVNRFAQQYSQDAIDLIKAFETEKVAVTATKTKKATKAKSTPNPEQKYAWLMESYNKQKGVAYKEENRKSKVGRAKTGVKTIRFITMEILEAHFHAETLTKANKANIIAEIMNKGAVDEKTAKQYYSGHHKAWGGHK